MNRAADNAIYALWLSAEVKEILERDSSSRAWSLVDKSKLPSQCFLWVEDRTKKKTWHLPYREGTGGIDPDTKMYRRAGLVNLNALRAISQAIGGARTGTPMIIPKQIKTKITKLLKEFDIGRFAESKEDSNMAKTIDIHEASISGQFKESKIDKENRLIRGVVLLRSSSSNRYFQGSVGTKFSEAFLEGVASQATGTKAYIDHKSQAEMAKTQGVRSVRDLLGYYESGRMEGGVPKANIKYLAGQSEFVESLLEDMPDKIGLSIVANGDMAYDRGTKIAEGISCKKLKSVDLVTETGSTVNLFESDNGNEEDNNMDYKDVTIQQLTENRPDLIEGLKKSILDEVSKTGEVETLKKNISELQEANKILKQKNDEYIVKGKAAEKTEEINALLEESKLKEEFITDTFRETLSDAKDEKAMKALIEDRKKLIESGKATGVRGMGDTQINEIMSNENYKTALESAATERG